MKVLLFSYNGDNYYAHGHAIHRMRIRGISVDEVRNTVISSTQILNTRKNAVRHVRFENGEELIVVCKPCVNTPDKHIKVLSVFKKPSKGLDLVSNA